MPHLMSPANVAAAAVCLWAFAATPARTQAIDAAGTSCAQFLKARAGDALHRQVSTWLYGYARGFNAAMRSGGGPGGPTLSSDQLLKYAADYCRANPDATIEGAASVWAPPAP